MKRLLLMIVLGSFCSVAAIAADPYEDWLTKQNQRGTEIEFIRVANQKPLVATQEADQEVARILDEVETIEKDSNDHEEVEESLK
jgi:hypothetical protein